MRDEIELDVPVFPTDVDYIRFPGGELRIAEATPASFAPARDLGARFLKRFAVKPADPRATDHAK